MRPSKRPRLGEESERPTKLFRSPRPYAKTGDPIQALPCDVRFEIFRFLFKPTPAAALIKRLASYNVCPGHECTGGCWDDFVGDFLDGSVYAAWIPNTPGTRALGRISLPANGERETYVIYSTGNHGLVLVNLHPGGSPSWAPWPGFVLTPSQQRRHDEWAFWRECAQLNLAARKETAAARWYVREAPPVEPTMAVEAMRLQSKACYARRLARTTKDRELSKLASAWAARASELAPLGSNERCPCCRCQYRKLLTPESESE